MDPQYHRAGPQPLDREGVIDLGGLRVINRKCLGRGQGQVAGDGRCLQCGESGPAREVLEQKPLPVELVGRANGAGLL